MILIKKKAFEKNLRSELVELRIKSSDIKSGMLVAQNKQVTNSAIQGIMFDRTSSKLSSAVIRPIIIEACLRSEMAAAGSGELCLDFILSVLPKLLMRQRQHSQEAPFDIGDHLKDFLNTHVNAVKSNSQRPTRESVLSHIQRLNIPNVCKKIILETHNLAGKS